MWSLALTTAGCSDGGGNIDATADMRFELPDDVAADLEYPVVVTLSIGPQGREEENSSLATQTSVVFCRALDPFVYHDSLRLRANCKLEDFYVRAALRSVTLDDEAACEGADRDGILLVDDSEMDPGNRIIADAGSAAWKEGDCGSQYESFDLVLDALD